MQVFGQEAEDAVLRRIFEKQARGFYVDVGAHHPFRFSNTYWAYQRGWHGLNIDATPGFERAFQIWRRRDINLLASVTNNTSTSETPFYIFSDPALNTTNRARSEELQETGHTLLGTTCVPALTLDEILTKHLPSDVSQIDLLTVDVEGAEMEVLRGNDWTRFSPRVLVLEILHCTVNSVTEHEAVRYLLCRGFQPVSMLYHSVIFVSDAEVLHDHWHVGS